jgi:hypothetical protein
MRKTDEFRGSDIKEPIIIEVIAVGQDQGEYARLSKRTGR